MQSLNIHPSYNIQVIPVPGADEDVYVIDDFLTKPEKVLDFAQKTAYLNAKADGTLYPGKRDDMPAPYYDALGAFLQPSNSHSEIAFFNKRIDIYRCLLSLTTTPPEQLIPPQKIPHVDSTDDSDYASVHYLCDASHGGTGFFRYKPTGHVQIKTGQEGVFQDMLEKTQREHREHEGYLCNNTSLFERVVYVEAKFNRLIIYKSNLLHSAIIHSPISHIDSIEQGRLSVASFFYTH